ncbi:MAG: enoyl-CoA hydratase/isomerase family protein, partial [Candidatus Rokuibacteriota bacterium]
MDPGYAAAWHDGVAAVRLACGKANALNARSLAALAAALDEAEKEDARAVVLTGYDRFFSSGLDLVSLYELDRPAMDAFVRDFDRVLLRVFAFPCPVVAAVNGHAVAGGCILALACDTRLVAAGDGRIGLNEILLGLPFPASALEIARHAVPAPSLDSVLYGGTLYDPEAALAHGLADGVCPADVVAEAREVAEGLAERPAGAFRTIKASLKAPALDRARATLEPLREARTIAPDGRRSSATSAAGPWPCPGGLGGVPDFGRISSSSVTIEEPSRSGPQETSFTGSLGGSTALTQRLLDK